MSRSERLLSLLQILRRHRRPVSGKALAAELGISIRTLYRDIASLQGQGAHIDGEPGVGYVLRPGFMLPPLMFSAEEIEALVLGMRWVADRTDKRLGDAARTALARIDAVLPAELRRDLALSPLFVGPAKDENGNGASLELLRRAIQAERKLTMTYRDALGRLSERTVWPFALSFFDHVRVVIAWCELRQGFRHFRTDRMVNLSIAEERYPRRRYELLKVWCDEEGIDTGRLQPF